jgi:hypothetical protein
MAKPGRATQKKRERERAQKEKQQEKRSERALRKETRDTELKEFQGEDPDLIGIYPGPQPVRND